MLFGANVFFLSLGVGVLVMLSLEYMVGGGGGGGDVGGLNAASAAAHDETEGIMLPTTDEMLEVVVKDNEQRPLVQKEEEQQQRVTTMPRMLLRKDVEFLIDELEALKLSTCSSSSAPRDPNEEESNDRRMHRSAMELMAKLLSDVEAEVGAVGTQPLAEATERQQTLEVKRDVLLKAQYLAERFTPDFSAHPNPGAGLRQALVRYLRRALLH